jgi:hypothetical protein
VSSVVILILFDFNEKNPFLHPVCTAPGRVFSFVRSRRSRWFSSGRSGLRFSHGFRFLAAGFTGPLFFSCSRFLSPVRLSQREASVLQFSVLLRSLARHSVPTRWFQLA